MTTTGYDRVRMMDDIMRCQCMLGYDDDATVYVPMTMTV